MKKIYLFGIFALILLVSAMNVSASDSLLVNLGDSVASSNLWWIGNKAQPSWIKFSVASNVYITNIQYYVASASAPTPNSTVEIWSYTSTATPVARVLNCSSMLPSGLSAGTYFNVSCNGSLSAGNYILAFIPTNNQTGFYRAGEGTSATAIGFHCGRYPTDTYNLSLCNTTAFTSKTYNVKIFNGTQIVDTSGIFFISPTPLNNTKRYFSDSVLNVTVNNSLPYVNTTIYLYSEDRSLLTSVVGVSNLTSLIADLSVGTYYFNATSRNLSGSNSTDTRTFILYEILGGVFNSNNVVDSRYKNVSWTPAITTNNSVAISYYELRLFNGTGISLLYNGSINNTLLDVYSYNLLFGSSNSLLLTVADSQGIVLQTSSQVLNVTKNAVLNLTAYDLITNVSINNLNVTVIDQLTGLSEVWNTTGSLLNIDIVKGRNYILSFDVPNYAYESVNYTSNTSTYQKLNQSLTKTNSVRISVFDEGSLALITNVTGGGVMNITFISDLGSITYNTTTGTLFVSNITANTYEVKFNAPLYAQRSYYLNITDRSTQTLNAYLSQSTINLLLTYVNKETGELIENVGINVYKIINGTWTAVATGFTDITGRWQVSVTTNTNYRFSSAITGYDDKTFNLNPVIFTSYTIQLTKQQSSSTQLDFSNINVYILNTTFRNNGSNTFSWQISAPTGNLEQYAYSLSTQCKNISSFSGVNAFGGINVDTFNLTCASVTDHITLKYNYTLTGGEIRSFVYTYSVIGTAKEGSFMSNNNETYGMGLFERILIVVLITIIFAGLISKFSNIVAGLGAGLLIMSYLSYIGFIEWWLIAPTLLVGFVLITSWSTSR